MPGAVPSGAAAIATLLLQRLQEKDYQSLMIREINLKADSD